MDAAMSDHAEARRAAPERFPFTKFLPPVLDERVATDHLVARLDATIRSRPLTVVTAPAGSGKTTALAAWAATSASDVVWIRLGPHDDGPTVLAAALLEGGRRQLGRGFGRRLARLLAYTAAVPTPHQLATALVNDLGAGYLQRDHRADRQPTGPGRTRPTQPVPHPAPRDGQGHLADPRPVHRVPPRATRGVLPTGARCAAAPPGGRRPATVPVATSPARGRGARGRCGADRRARVLRPRHEHRGAAGARGRCPARRDPRRRPPAGTPADVAPTHRRAGARGRLGARAAAGPAGGHRPHTGRRRGGGDARRGVPPARRPGPRGSGHRPRARPRRRRVASGGPGRRDLVELLPQRLDRGVQLPRGSRGAGAALRRATPAQGHRADAVPAAAVRRPRSGLGHRRREPVGFRSGRGRSRHAHRHAAGAGRRGVAPARRRASCRRAATVPVRVHWLADEHRQVVATYERLLAGQPSSGLAEETVVRAVAESMVARIEGRTDDVLQLLRDGEEAQRAGRCWLWSGMPGLDRASSLVEDGRAAAAIEAALPTLDVAARVGPGTLVPEARANRALLERCARAGLHTDLLRAVLAVGQSSAGTRATVAIPGTDEALSPRELEVLEGVATGASNRDIATVLFISEPTVKSHLTRILRKLQASSRTHAVARARELRLL